MELLYPSLVRTLMIRIDYRIMMVRFIMAELPEASVASTEISAGPFVDIESIVIEKLRLWLVGESKVEIVSTVDPNRIRMVRSSVSSVTVPVRGNAVPAVTSRLLVGLVSITTGASVSSSPQAVHINANIKYPKILNPFILLVLNLLEKIAHL